MNAKKRVVITGYGTVNPAGNNASETWDNVVNGRSGIGPITLFDASQHKTRIAGEVKNFDPVALFGRKESRHMPRATQLAMAAAQQAITHAQINFDDALKQRTGVTIGNGMGMIDTAMEATRQLDEKGATRISPFFIPLVLPNTPSAQISIAYGLQGPNLTLITACAAANNAIGEAAHMIQHGRVDVMLAGGAEASVTPLVIGGFSSMGALSTSNDEPTRVSRPFDAGRDGFVASEGAAVLVLEELSHAQARGATIYGEFLGYGTTADAYHITAPAEDGAGAAHAMRLALQDAGLSPHQIGYINAHGTSTPLNDKTETLAIKTLFGEHAYAIPISSTKSVHGHLLGATPALEAILCLKVLELGIIPPTINYETPDPACDLDYVPNVARPAAVTTTLSNGFGMGGHNATLILGRYLP